MLKLIKVVNLQILDLHTDWLSSTCNSQILLEVNSMMVQQKTIKMLLITDKKKLQILTLNSPVGGWPLAPDTYTASPSGAVEQSSKK